jgi:two-component system KDP operon response regulator KdpE
LAANARILVIDDDETILDLIKETLSSDYQILTAHDALEGVDLLMSERFDLLIIDLGMPVVDGVELIEKIRANSPFEKTPILVVSAFPELRRRLAGADVQAILPKPFSLDDLTRKVAETIRRSDGREANQI